MIVQLSESAGFGASDDDGAKFVKLKGLLESAEANASAISLISELLGISVSGEYAPLQMPPAQKRQQIFSVLVQLLANLAQKAPVLAIVEDVHWVDPTTAEYIALVVRSIGEASVLLVVTGRPEYEPPAEWAKMPHSNHFVMRGLSVDDVQKLAENVAGAALPASVMKEIASKTDGVPLFVEEFTKSLAESESLERRGDRYELTGTVALSAIPARLEDSLTARLDRQPDAKAVAQMAAALGREFSVDHLAAISTSPVVSLGLKQLEAAGLIFQRRASTEPKYVFKHALVQDAAYASLLVSKRKTLHRRIAEALASRFPSLATREPEVFAAHWSRSDQPEQSARFWLKAGQSALRRSAYFEALSHIRQGIAFLKPDTSHSDSLQLEFDLHLCAGQSSYVVNGPAAAETTKAYSRALDLIDRVGKPEQRLDLLYGIFSGYHFASKFDLARAPAEKALELALKMQDAGQRCQAYRMLGYLSFFEGHLSDALRQFDSLASLYDPKRDSPMAVRYGADSLVAARGFEAVVHGAQGRPSTARTLLTQNVESARRLNHPPTLGWALASGGYLNYFLAAPEATLTYVDEGARYCEQNNVAVWGLHCRIFEAWAKSAFDVGGADRTTTIRDAIANSRTRILLGVPLFRAILADLLSRRGEFKEAISEVDGAVEDLASTGQRFFGPTIFYVRAECLGRCRSDCIEEIVSCYQRSAESAHLMGASLLELRAYNALAQISGDSARQAAAIAAVDRLYHLIQKRSDVADLRAARGLLESARAGA
jgi:tetratricopeptide (TPR) repeat protein